LTPTGLLMEGVRTNRAQLLAALVSNIGERNAILSLYEILAPST